MPIYDEKTNTVIGSQVIGGGSGGTPGPHAPSHKGDGTDPVDVATITVDGLLSSEDKVKLDNLVGGMITTEVRNETGGTLLKHRAVAVIGYSETEGLPLVDYADKDDSDLRPAIGVTMVNFDDEENSPVMVVGTIVDIDTSSYALTDQLVLGSNGNFIRPPPDEDPFTGEVQNICSVSRVHSSNGEIIVNIDGLNPVTGTQIFALAGTSGTPSKTNQYVTNADSRMSDSRTPSAHAASHVGLDAIQDASASQSGLATAAQITKLNSAVLDTLVDAKGDLLAGTADDTVGRLPAATVDGYVLTSASGETTGLVWASNFSGSTGRVLFPCRKASAGTINKGKAVYIVSYNVAGYIEVEAAQANSSSTMPCIGLANTALTNSITGEVIFSGDLNGFDTDTWSVQDELWVSPTAAGDLVNSRPTGSGSLVQKVAQVTRDNPTVGAVQVFGAGRSNDVPNIAEGDFWLGDSDGVAQASSFASHATKFQFFADQLEYPLTADWPVNAHAGGAVDSNNSGIAVRRFDDTDEEGVGFTLRIPEGATNIRIRISSRAETAPGTTDGVALLLYKRDIPDNAAVGSWSAGYQMVALSIPTNEYWQYDSQEITLSALSLTAGRMTQFELVRDTIDAGDDLVGDWTLEWVGVEFS